MAASLGATVILSSRNKGKLKAAATCPRPRCAR
ncbi:MAG: hypothetical protein AAF414_05030 [Pseudomonadota bacterium]